MPQPAWKQTWERRARFLALRINVSSWLEGFAPWCFGLASLAAVGLFALRRLREPLMPALWAVVALGGASALAVLWQRRRSFYGLREARVLLEYQLGLDARLSAAAEGIGSWPEPRPVSQKLLCFHMGTVGLWLGLSFILVVGSLWLPVPALPSKVLVSEKAPALAEVESLMEALKQSEIADAESLESLSSEARQLGSRPAEEQYSHAALEAAEHLRDQVLSDTQNLARSFEDAEKALEESAPGMTDEQAKQAAEQLQASLQGMRAGDLKANQQLSSQLKGLQASQLKQMTKAQLERLRQQMGASGAKARGVAGARSHSQVAKGGGERVKGKGMGGGPGGGGEAAPLSFSDQASPSLEGKIEETKSEDYSRASLSDNLQTTDGRHDFDAAKAQHEQSAGGVGGKAQGGEAVWVNRLTPVERSALKDFFK